MSKKKIKHNMVKEEPKTITEENQIKSFFIILTIMLILFAVFYFLTVWIKYEKKRYVPLDYKTEINYEKILLGNVFDYSGEYYVLVVDGDYEEYFEKIKSELGVTVDSVLKKTCYTVSMNDHMNSKYIAEVSNLNVTDVKDLKVSTTTLLHIKNKKIVKTYEGSEAIFKYLHDSIK